MEYMIISVNTESADIFLDFADSNPDIILPIQHKAFIGPDEIMEFIVTLGPATLSALAAYFVAKIQYSKKEIRIKRGETEIELKNVDLTPDDVMDMLLKLDQRNQNEQRHQR